jgi:hypothetical protein
MNILFDAPDEIIFSNFDRPDASHVRSRRDNQVFSYAALRAPPEERGDALLHLI